jgi:hypothetical protein
VSIITPPRLVTRDVPQIRDVSADVSEDLAGALALISLGVPVFVAKPNSTYDKAAPHKLTDGKPNPAAVEFYHPKGWHLTPASTSTLSNYQPGDALCAVTGHTMDAVDVDVKHGADVGKEQDRLAALGVTVIGSQVTPSGGAHLFIPATGIHSAANPVTGVDFRGGGVNGEGRGFIYLAPTSRPKYAGGGYVLAQVPDTASLDLTEATLCDNTDSTAAYLNAVGIKPRTQKVGKATVTGGEPVDVIPEKLQAAIEAEPPWGVNQLTGEISGGDNTNSGRFYHLVAEIQRAQLTQGQAVTLMAEWCNRFSKYVGRVDSEVARAWVRILNQQEWANTLPPSVTNDLDDQLEDEPSTWLPVDLSEHLAGTYVPLKPTMLIRADGHGLIYPGKIHSIYGESESGKSFVMQHFAAVEIMAGRKVLYIDFEDSPGEIVHRLKLFGATPEQIRSGFTYVQPMESLGTIKAQAAFMGLLKGEYSLCVVDGFTTAMNMIAPSTGSPESQVAQFMAALPRKIVRRTKAAVITVDHVVKAKDSRGRFAVGSQEKINQVTGAAYAIEVERMIAPGNRGELVVRVTKDRIGQVRANAGKWRANDRTQEVARFVVDSTDPTWCNVIVENPEEKQAGTWRPTYLMQKVSEYLEACTEPLSTKAIKEAIAGKAEHVGTALAMLVTDGYAEQTKGARGALLHKSISPYLDPEQISTNA